MRVLIVSDCLPYPPISGSRVRVYNLVRRVAKHCEVAFASFTRTEADLGALDHMRDLCAQVETVGLERRHPLSHVPGLVGCVLRRIPLELKFYQSRELAAKVLGITETFRPDVVQIERSVMAPYIEQLPPAAAEHSVLVFHDAASQQYGRIAAVERNQFHRFRSLAHARAMGRWEPEYASRFRYCVAVSEADRRLLLHANPRLRIEVVPNGVDTSAYQPLPHPVEGASLIFVGSMGYAPNSDGAVWLAREVLPHITRMVAGADLWVVGDRPPQSVKDLSAANVHVTGRVEDLTPYYRRSAVAVVPLRAGGGTRLKILEAMALGRPVVSTSVGAEGLEAVPGRHLLIADAPEDFARQVVSLLTNPQLRHELTTAARQMVVERYDWDAIASGQMELYRRIAANGSSH